MTTTQRARSSLECQLYMALHPCACGEVRAPAGHRLVSGEAGLVAIYKSPCAGCGAPRSFAFALDDEIVPLDAYGGARPSTIIDAGEWLAVADAHAQARPVDAHHLDRAVAALDEALKLIPAGHDAVPEASLASSAGQLAYAREPARFRRARIEALRNMYRAMRAQLA